MTIDEALAELNKVANEVLNEGNINTHHAWYYCAGEVGNYKVKYTKLKVNFKGKIGFYSWIERAYKNNKIKRFRIVKSGSRIKAEQRANRLLKQLQEKLK